MQVVKTSFEGLVIIEPEVHHDARGYFFESFNRRTFSRLGLPVVFVQENISRSRKNVVRGLHFQRPPMSQSKLVWVINGLIRDVVIDLRRGQPTFGKSYMAELSADNLRRLFVPVGFAHGFSVLSDYADVCYMCDEFFSPNHQTGIFYQDPILNIDWGVSEKDCIVSKKDLELPGFAETVTF